MFSRSLTILKERAIIKHMKAFRTPSEEIKEIALELQEQMGAIDASPTGFLVPAIMRWLDENFEGKEITEELNQEELDKMIEEALGEESKENCECDCHSMRWEMCDKCKDWHVRKTNK